MVDDYRKWCTMFNMERVGDQSSSPLGIVFKKGLIGTELVI